MIALVSEFYKAMFPLLVLTIVPIIAAAVCFAIDTYIDFRYYQWNKENREKENSPMVE